MAVSINQVAALASVSRMSVSRVIRGESGVSEKTKLAVVRAMQELNYIPSMAARALRSRDPLINSGAACFAMIFAPDTQVDDEFFCDVARGAENEAGKHGLCPIHVHWQRSIEKSWKRLQTVLSVPTLCGCLLVGQFDAEEVAKIQGLVKFVVFVDGPAPKGCQFGSVEADNFGGCRMAIEHLIERDSRRLLIITGPKEHYFSQAMMLAGNSLRTLCRTMNFVQTDYSADQAISVIKQHFQKQNAYDGVFCNDKQAIGVLRAFKDKAIEVPQKVRLVGFDDIPLASIVIPRLTTVAVNKRQLGEQAVKALMDTVRAGRIDNDFKIVIKASLVQRETS
jgi:LacI family transcriptional regulator